MHTLSDLRAAVLEKQDVVSTRLVSMAYDEVLPLMASLSSLVYALETVHVQHEVQCNQVIMNAMEEDPKISFSKAEAVMKVSSAYSNFREALSLRQLASRGLGLAKIHCQHLLQAEIPEIAEPE